MSTSNEKTFGHERRVTALRLLLVLQNVKAAVALFDEGEINLEDAVRRITEAVQSRRAA